jgi:hypothetical protein
LSQKRQFFCRIFGENIFKITTFAQSGHPDGRAQKMRIIIKAWATGLPDGFFSNQKSQFG